MVRRKVNDVNYEIDLGSRKRKRFRLFHINMLRRWYETNSFVEEEAEEVDADEEAEPDLPSWGPTEEAEQQCEYEVSDHLTEEQKPSLQQLLAAFKDTLQNKPGRTQVTEHSLHTGGERPGLQGAPATFQRMMDQLLRSLEESASAYIDDVVVHSMTWDDHLVALKAVLGVLKEAGLTVKPAKCHFAMKECCYLGHVVGNGQVRPDSGPDYCS